MQGGHLTEQLLRRALSSREERDVTCLAGHLARCPVCFAVVRRLEELSRMGGLDLWFPTVERELSRLRVEAPVLWEALQPLPVVQQHALVRHTRRYRHWGLCELLCEESARLAASEPAVARDRAEVAVSLAMALAEWEPLDACGLRALRAFAWAHLGNAQRVLGDLRGAERAFAEMDSWVQDAELAAEALSYSARLGSLKGSLRRTQGRLPEALDLLAAALAGAAPEEAAGVRIKRAMCLEALSELDAALAELAAAEELLEEPGRLLLCVRHNAVDFLSRAGHFVRAAEALPAVEALAARYGTELDRLRLAWMRARIVGGLGDPASGRAALDGVRAELLRRGLAYDGALASLELAVLCLRCGDTAAVKEVARAIMPLFKAQELHREALAALAVFRHAAEAEWITLEVAERLAGFLMRARDRPDLRLADVPGLTPG